VLTMDECERIVERPRGMFYRGPMMGAKCSYQNQEPWHIGMDVVEWGPELHTLAWRGALTGGGPTKQRTSMPK